MFHYIEEMAKSQKIPLKLYVELENERAMGVYKRLGMVDSNFIFMEDDFYFDKDRI